MRFRAQKIFPLCQVGLQGFLLLFFSSLPFLSAQSNEINTGQLKCLGSVAKCLSSCALQVPDNQEYSFQKYVTSMMYEHKTELISHLWTLYGNLTEQLEILAKPQLEVLQRFKKLNGTLQKCQENSDMKHVDLTDGVGELKNKLEELEASQKGAEENILQQIQLSQCNWTYSQTEVNQSCQCKGSLTEYDLRGLRYLVLQRYNESDVVQAARFNDLQQLRLLLDAGMKVDSRDPSWKRETPLHTAANRGYLQVIKFLVERGAPLEARNTDNNTPLIHAASGGKLLAVKLLVELGADPLAKGFQGETPRDRAARDGRTQVVEWLKDNGW